MLIGSQGHHPEEHRQRVVAALALAAAATLLAGCPTNEAGQAESNPVGTLDGAGSSAQSAALSDDELASDFVGCAPGTKGINVPAYISPLVLDAVATIE